MTIGPGHASRAAPVAKQSTTRWWRSPRFTSTTLSIRLPVFVRAGAIVPEQPLVQSTDEKPDGPLTLRVYPPTGTGKECSGSLYLDDGISYNFKQGDFLRMGFTCRLTQNGIIVEVAAHEGSFTAWWKLLSVEIYGAAKPAASASTSAPDGSGTAAVSTAFDAAHHRITALVPDDGKASSCN